MAAFLILANLNLSQPIICMEADPQPSPTPTSQETSKVSVASPPAEFSNQRKPPLGGIDRLVSGWSWPIILVTDYSK